LVTLQQGLPICSTSNPSSRSRMGSWNYLNGFAPRASKAWERLIELASTQAAGRPIERMAIAQVAALEMARKFETQLRERMACPVDIIFCELPPGLSVHSGAGLVGVRIRPGIILSTWDCLSRLAHIVIKTSWIESRTKLRIYTPANPRNQPGTVKPPIPNRVVNIKLVISINAEKMIKA
jgi:hypothetical protein